MPRVVRRTSGAVSDTGHGTAFEQYLSEIRRLPLLSIDEERALARRAREGCPIAAEQLVTANLRFVISYVKRYQGQGIDFPDLVAIGNEGLVRAAEKFDPERGVKFISYAVWWVRQSVLKALLEQTTMVRIPSHRHAARVRLVRTRRLLTRELERTPTDDELASALGVSLDEVRQTLACITRDISLDAPVSPGDADAPALDERLRTDDPHAPSTIEVETDLGLRREFLQQLFRQYLTPREVRVLTLHFGLDGTSDPLSLEQIGPLLGVTRERVRQVRERALAKLRGCPDVQRLGGSLLS